MKDLQQVKLTVCKYTQTLLTVNHAKCIRVHFLVNYANNGPHTQEGVFKVCEGIVCIRLAFANVCGKKRGADWLFERKALS